MITLHNPISEDLEVIVLAPGDSVQYYLPGFEDTEIQSWLNNKDFAYEVRFFAFCLSESLLASMLITSNTVTNVHEVHKTLLNYSDTVPTKEEVQEHVQAIVESYVQCITKVNSFASLVMGDVSEAKSSETLPSYLGIVNEVFKSSPFLIHTTPYLKLGLTHDQAPLLQALQASSAEEALARIQALLELERQHASKE